MSLNRNNAALQNPSLLLAAKTAPLLEADEELRLALAARAGSKQAVEQLVTSHLRLVIAIAQSYAKHGLPLEELVSEGMLGLMEACQRFEAERGARFAVYAAWWIRAYVRRYTIAYRRIVRTPSTRNARKLLSSMRRTERELTQRDGEPAEAARVASALGVTVEDVETMEAALGGRDVPVGPVQDGQPHVELSDQAPTPEEQALARCAALWRVEGIQRALDVLDARERAIVERRYLGDESISLAEIARHLGLSRERVRQLEHRAHRKMRDVLSARVA